MILTTDDLGAVSHYLPITSECVGDSQAELLNPPRCSLCACLGLAGRRTVRDLLHLHQHTKDRGGSWKMNSTRSAQSYGGTAHQDIESDRILHTSIVASNCVVPMYWLTVPDCQWEQRVCGTFTRGHSCSGTSTCIIVAPYHHCSLVSTTRMAQS